MSRLTDCLNLDDIRALAKKKVPRAVFDYADGGAETETTRYRNLRAFDDWQLVPAVLKDVAKVDTRTRVLGTDLDWPLVLSPTALGYLFHRHGEPAVARAATRAGTLFTLSSIATASLADIAKEVTGPKWFQLYVWKDRGLTRALVEACKELGYKALLLTVDAPVAGMRERDTRNGMTIPPKLSLSALIDAALHPAWWMGYLKVRPIQFANVQGKVENLGQSMTDVMSYINGQFDPTVTWDEAQKLMELWDGPFAIKGIMRPEDAERAVEMGAAGVAISNHGGRQLDPAPAPLDVLADIVQAVGDRADVLLDGGVRRGADILKALALGAKACMTGRPYVYGLCAGGEAGVDRVLTLLRESLERSMRLMCLKSLKELDASYIRRLPPGTGRAEATKDTTS